MQKKERTGDFYAAEYFFILNAGLEWRITAWFFFLGENGLGLDEKLEFWNDFEAC